MPVRIKYKKPTLAETVKRYKNSEFKTKHIIKIIFLSIKLINFIRINAPIL